MSPKTSPIRRSASASAATALLAGWFGMSLNLIAAAAENTATTMKESPEPAKDAPSDKAAAEPAPGDYRNWFDVSVGGLIVDGDKAAAQRRLSLPATAFGGVEDFHYEHDVGKRGLFKIDGRGIFDNKDYALRLEFNQPDKGFVRAGIRQTQDYSDGSGGWFPGNNQWFNLYDDRFALVRSSAFFEAGLRLPNIPEITVRYAHDSSDGLTDSTIWGGTSLTGGAGVRSIVPAFRDIDETTDTVTLDVRHTLGNTTFGGAFTYETSDLNDSLNLRRQPYEPSDRYTTQTERVEQDLYSARVFVDTVFHDRLRLTTAYMFTTLDTDIGGSRIVGSDYEPVYDPANARRDVGFLNLTGGSQLDQHVWSLNLLWMPFPNFVVIPAFRLEDQSLDGASSWLNTGAGDIAREAANSRDMLDLSQQLELRYTGVTNVVMYARGDWVEGDGNLLESQFLNNPGLTELHRDSDFDRFSQKYTAGVHWYPHKEVNLHAQYYRKMRDDRYHLDAASYVNLLGSYPGFIEANDFVTDDVNFRVTWRPLAKLTLVTRYDYQFNTIELDGVGLNPQQSAHGTTHILGEAITWTPLPRLYIQPGVNFVLDTTRSHAASIAPTLENAHNDYFNVTCTVGVVLDDRTDFQAQYSYYLASNFNDLSAFTQPYGAGAEEHGILASLVRRISPRLRLSLRYGFFSSRSEVAGGFNDYNAHLVSTSVQYLF